MVRSGGYIRGYTSKAGATQRVNDLRFCTPPGIRTRNLRIKSPLLCR